HGERVPKRRREPSRSLERQRQQDTVIFVSHEDVAPDAAALRLRALELDDVLLGRADSVALVHGRVIAGCAGCETTATTRRAPPRSARAARRDAGARRAR